jgi:cobalt-precorrin 5A hydrolase
MTALVVGLGARAGTAPVDLTGAIVTALAAAGLPLSDVEVLATLDRRAAEDGVRAVAAAHGWELAEAAALAAAGPDATLVLPKRTFAQVTVAVAERVSPCVIRPND